MLPSLSLTLAAMLAALAAAAVAAVAVRRATARWGYLLVAWAGMLAGWLVLAAGSAALTDVKLCLALVAALALVGGLADRFRLPLLARLPAAAAALAAFGVIEYRRGDLYAVQAASWAGVGVVTWYAVAFTGAPGRDVRSASASLARITPLAGACFALVGLRLPNPGLTAYAALVTAATGVAYLATVRSGKPVGPLAVPVLGGLLFTMGWYAWSGNAAPELAMAPLVPVCADAAWTLARRVAGHRILGPEPTRAGQLLGVLDPRDDSVHQRTARLAGARAADRDLLAAAGLSIALALAEWFARVPAVPGAAPFAVLALAYALSPDVRGAVRRARATGARRRRGGVPERRRRTPRRATLGRARARG